MMSTIAEKILLLLCSIFLVFAPYEHKYIGKTLFLSGFILWVSINILKYKRRFYRGLVPTNVLNKPFLVFGVACALSIIFSLDRHHSIDIFFERYLMYIVFFWIGSGISTISKSNLYFLCWTFLFSSLIFSLGGARDYFYYYYVLKNPVMSERIWSVFDRQIPYYAFPLYLTYFTPFVFSVFSSIKRKWIKLACSLGLVLLLLCLIFNASRAAWVSVILSLLCISLIGNKKRNILMLLIFVSLFSIALFIFSNKTTKERIQTVFYPSEWSFRLPLYKSAISIFNDYPIFGVGIGNYAKVLHTPEYELSNNYTVPKALNLHAHNTYLEIAAEMGIPGFVAFIWIFIVFFKNVFRRIAKLNRENVNENAMLSGLSGTIFAILLFALSTTIITVGVNNSVYFWFLFGMAASLLTKNEGNILKNGQLPT